MTRHEQTISGTRIEATYDVDTLGAPFKVTLLDSVTIVSQPRSGDRPNPQPLWIGQRSCSAAGMSPAEAERRGDQVHQKCAWGSGEGLCRHGGNVA